MEKEKIRVFIAVGLATVVLSGCATNIEPENSAGLKQGTSNKPSQVADINTNPLRSELSPLLQGVMVPEALAPELAGRARPRASAHFWDD